MDDQILHATPERLLLALGTIEPFPHNCGLGHIARAGGAFDLGKERIRKFDGERFHKINRNTGEVKSQYKVARRPAMIL